MTAAPKSPESVEPVTRWCFGAFVLDVRQRRLERSGAALDLSPKQFDALQMLVERAGDLIGKQEFQARLWPSTVVSETSLNKLVWQLRRVLDGGEAASLIETVPKLGYRFIGEVRPEPVSTAARAAGTGETSAAPVERGVPAELAADREAPVQPRKPWSLLAVALLAGLSVLLAVHRYRQPAAQPTPAITSIAVLPFKPLAAAERDPVLELGLADTLIEKLSRIRHVVVRSIESVRRYEALDQDPVAAGQALEVGAVLEGQLQQHDGRLRLTARLLAVPGGASLWSGSFDTTRDNLFAMQDAIAQQVADALALAMDANERRALSAVQTRDPEAYRLYLTGRYHINKARPDEILVGIAALRQAIERDPSYALAYAGMAEGYERLPITGDLPPRENFPLAKAAAEKALQIDPGLAEAHSILGWVAFWYDWDWVAAERHFRRSIELNPNVAEARHGYGHLLWLQGRSEESRREGRRARELDPLSPLINTITAAYETDADGEPILRRVLALDPEFWIAHLSVGGNLLRAGRYDEAIAEFERGIRSSNGNLHAVSGRAIALVRAGRADEARAVVVELEARAKRGYIPGTSIARILVALGERERAFAWLQRALEERDVDLSFIKVMGAWDPIRQDPRFVAIARQVGVN